MRLFMFLSILIISIQCIPKTERLSIKIVEGLDKIALPVCEGQDSILTFRIDNFSNDTILVFVPDYLSGKCLFSSKVKYFKENSNRDSLIGIALRLEDSWDVKYDTLFPWSSSFYAGNKWKIMYGFNRSPYTQLYFPYQTTQDTVNELFLKLLLNYNQNTNTLKQLEFIVPEGVGQFKIP